MEIFIPKFQVFSHKSGTVGVHRVWVNEENEIISMDDFPTPFIAASKEELKDMLEEALKDLLEKPEIEESEWDEYYIPDVVEFMDYPSKDMDLDLEEED